MTGDAVRQRLTEISERAAGATAGPWYFTEPGQCCKFACLVSADEAVIHDACCSYADGKFIAEGRSDTPWLVAVISAVLDACAGLEQFAKSSASDYDHGSAHAARTVQRVVAAALEEQP